MIFLQEISTKNSNVNDDTKQEDNVECLQVHYTHISLLTLRDWAHSAHYRIKGHIILPPLSWFLLQIDT